MSSYIKLIIFIAVLILISFAVISMDSSMDNINKSMPEVSDGIVQGDKDYNESVELLNSKYFVSAMEKAESAGNNYNDSLNKLLSIQDKFDKDLNDVHKEYIDAAVSELQFKLKAVDELKLSIEYLQDYYNYTGSNYASEANDLIYESLKFQNERVEIVKDNPKLFS